MNAFRNFLNCSHCVHRFWFAIQFNHEAVHVGIDNFHRENRLGCFGIRFREADRGFVEAGQNDH